MPKGTAYLAVERKLSGIFLNGSRGDRVGEDLKGSHTQFD